MRDVSGVSIGELFRELIRSTRVHFFGDALAFFDSLVAAGFVSAGSLSASFAAAESF